VTGERGGHATVYPTRAAIALVLAGAPVSLVLGLLAPDLWLVGVGWIAFAGCLILIDAVIGADGRKVVTDVRAPRAFSVNAVGVATVDVAFAKARPGALEIAMETGPALSALAPTTIQIVGKNPAGARFALIPVRRGKAALAQVWARWKAPLGLVWKQIARDPGLEVTITADIEGVKEEGVRLFAREAPHGLKLQLEAGEGADFHSLRDFQPGMDIRMIDWKRSASHGRPLAKEYRAERNNPVVLAIDTGRSMCEPIAGLARVDWALNAALLLAYVSLKVGDRVGLYSFDARPARMSGPVTGVRAFSALQRSAGEIDYSSEETNYTYGLSALADRLDRRTLVVVFTEFTDFTSAELMIETVGRLFNRHLVVFVVMRDEELDGLTHAEPVVPEDVSRAVIAGSLLRERDLVIARLRRLGVEIVDAPAKDVGPALLDRYLELKRRNRV